MGRLPPWIRTRLSAEGKYGSVRELLDEAGLNTVCRGAHCPNEHECFNRGTATFMILGDSCTRACRFCAIGHETPCAVDLDEPRRLAEVAARLKLRHVVITSVTRDDLPDGGAAHFAAAIRSVRTALPQAVIEVLVPDFKGDRALVSMVVDAAPDVFNHNLETVRRLQQSIRPQADYERSLSVLAMACEMNGSLAVKSGLMVGLGEEDGEIEEALRDLHAAGCRIVTIGQYLAPSAAHAPVKRFVEPSGFERYGKIASEIGFSAVASGPLVRSSYRAGELFEGAH